MGTQVPEKVSEKMRKVRCLLLDVDGVLTDGKLYFDNSGNELKTFNTLDGHGIKMLMQSGVEVGIITGRTSAVVEKRASDLGIELLIQGREDKYTALQELLAGRDYAAEEIAYVGDDYPDLQVMTRIGCPITVPNAASPLKQFAVWCTEKDGGNGAVREVCDQIMQAQGTFAAALTPYINQEH